MLKNLHISIFLLNFALSKKNKNMKNIAYTHLTIGTKNKSSLLFKGGFTQESFDMIVEAYNNGLFVGITFNEIGKKSEGFICIGKDMNGGVDNFFEAIHKASVNGKSRLTKQEVISEFHNEMSYYNC